MFIWFLKATVSQFPEWEFRTDVLLNTVLPPLQIAEAYFLEEDCILFFPVWNHYTSQGSKKHKVALLIIREMLFCTVSHPV